MGTRADFYIGRGEQAEWLGSIAWDGYPDGITPTAAEREVIATIELKKSDEWPAGGHLFDAVTEAEFRERLERYFANREDVTRPAQGWPWPWEDSQTTDYAYAFDGGKVWACPFGHGWFDPLKPEPEDERTKSAVFPNMKARANAQFGGARSGLIVVTSAGVE